MIHKWLRIDIITDSILGQAIFQPYNIIYIYIYIYIYDHVNILFYDSAALNSDSILGQAIFQPYNIIYIYI
jgi:hypothetical protein